MSNTDKPVSCADVHKMSEYERQTMIDVRRKINKEQNKWISINQRCEELGLSYGVAQSLGYLDDFK